MKKAVIAFLLVATTCMGQPFIKHWDKSFGGTVNDDLYSITMTMDGNILFSGTSQSAISGNKTEANCTGIVTGNSDIWLIKTDTAGVILWNKCYGGSNNEQGGCIAVMPNGNIVISCLTESDSSCNKTENGRGYNDCWIFMVDSMGNIVWDKTYGGNDEDGNDEPPVCTVANNGNILVANSSRSPISGDKTDSTWNFFYDYWIICMDSSGNKLWDKSYGGLGEDYVRGVCTTTNGDILVGGIAEYPGGGDITDSIQGARDYWLIKTDNNGNKLWDKRYGGSSDETLTTIKPTNDGGALLCGSTNSPISGDITEAPKGNRDTWVVKIDSIGNKQWDKRYGGISSLVGKSTHEYEDGYLIAATVVGDSANDVTEPTYGMTDYWVMKIDSVGTKRWDKRLGGNKQDELPQLAILSDNSIVVGGFNRGGSSVIKTDPGYGAYDYWAVKFKYNDPFVGLEEKEGATGIFVWPNPTINEVTIKSNNTSDRATLTIYDQTGKVVYVKENSMLNTRCNISRLAKGMYYLVVSNNILRQTMKIVKM